VSLIIVQPEDVEYGLHLPYHLAMAGMDDDLCDLLTEFEFIEYKLSVLLSTVAH
jgi:hypothetical protein